ncbi:glucan 1,4-alpha-glucosidase [Nakaseomyces bracarensis]|uniref:glucan 1,4-alpha-glucosidase n=1 Tax=Nakaseomyces bracarensis TaxID=273131 RepID=UPI003870EF44
MHFLLVILGVFTFFVSLPAVVQVLNSVPSYFSTPVTWLPHYIPRENFNEWLEAENSIALRNLLDNFLDDGVILASPSQSAPNYYYQWIRDSAIVINTLVKQLAVCQEPDCSVIHRRIVQYLNNSWRLQRIDNLSGRGVPTSTKGLGEPKFNVDFSSFDLSWGRPQNDGPALRVVTILNYLQNLNNSDTQFSPSLLSLNDYEDYTSQFLPLKESRDIYHEILYWDLLFIVNNWHMKNFDLWEEVYGFHFFTTVMQLYSIDRAIPVLETNKYFWGVDEQFLNKLINTRDTLLSFVREKGGFIDHTREIIKSCPQVLGERSGLDIATILASVYTHDEGNAGNDLEIFDVDDNNILNTLYDLIESMSELYPINKLKVENNNKKTKFYGTALGRYPEDVYDGIDVSEGNPWFLATAAASELSFKLIKKYRDESKDIVILKGNRFWSLVLDQYDPRKDITITYNSHGFNETLKSLMELGDSFLDTIRSHVANNGSMSEQFNKYTGFNQGARDLTWSYGAFLNTIQARNSIKNLL